MCDICGRVFNPYSEDDEDGYNYSLCSIWMNKTKEYDSAFDEDEVNIFYHFDMCYKCFRDKFTVWMKESFGANPQTDRLDL